MHMMSELGLRVGADRAGTPPRCSAPGRSMPGPPRGSKLCVRFFLGDAPGRSASSGAGAQPLFWHAFSMEQGQETAVDTGRLLDALDAGPERPHQRCRSTRSWSTAGPS